MKRFFLTAAAVMTSAVLFTASAEAIKPIGGWSEIDDKGTVTFDSTVTNDTAFKATLTREKGDGVDVWPSAYVTGVASESNLEGVTKVVVNYTVHKITDGADGVAVTLAATDATSGEFLIDREEPTTKKYYGSFVTVLTTGLGDNLGTAQSDTIEVSSDAFYLSYAGDSMADEDVCTNLEYTVSGTGDAAMVYLKNNLHVLGTVAGVAVSIESDVTKNADELEITVEGIEFLKEGSSVNNTFTNNNVAPVVNGLTNGKLNLTVPTSGSYEVSIMTANGRLIEKQSVTLSEAATNEISVKASSKGMYLVHVTGAGLDVTEKVSVK